MLTRIRAGAPQSLADARENLAATISRRRRKRPLLVDISRCQPLEPEVRHYYTGELLVESFRALGAARRGDAVRPHDGQHLPARGAARACRRGCSPTSRARSPGCGHRRERRRATSASRAARVAGADGRRRSRRTHPISPAHDELDAIAYGVNVLVGELRFAADDLRRAKEEAERANRAKTIFLRNISHEIRTPLTAILGLAELLADPGVDGARRADLVARIARNGRALLALVDDLLDLAKVEAGKLAVRDRGHCRRSTRSPRWCAASRPQARRKGVALSVERRPRRAGDHRTATRGACARSS